MMHHEKKLATLLKMGLDPEQNPLMKTVQNGSDQFEVDSMSANYPKFFKDFTQSKKKHGCNTLLMSFSNHHYSEDLSDKPSQLLAQLQYVQVKLWNQW